VQAMRQHTHWKCWGGRPPTASMCQTEVVSDLKQGGRPWTRLPVLEWIRPNTFSSVNAAEQPVLRRKLRRKDMVAFFERLPPMVVAIEACGCWGLLAMR
jgi:transposase